MSDLTLPHLQCSRRLFEIMLSHRRVTSAFIEGDNIVVTLEGEAARLLNFDTGKSWVKLSLSLVLDFKPVHLTLIFQVV